MIFYTYITDKFTNTTDKNTSKDNNLKTPNTSAFRAAGAVFLNNTLWPQAVQLGWGNQAELAPG